MTLSNRQKISIISLLCILIPNSILFAGDFGFGLGNTNIEATKEVGVPGVQNNPDEVDILNVIRSVINRVLGILGLIALIMVLYGGFLMLFAVDNDEKFNKGWKFVKTALLGLLIIGLSWFVISFILWLIYITTHNAMTVDA